MKQLFILLFSSIFVLAQAERFWEIDDKIPSHGDAQINASAATFLNLEIASFNAYLKAAPLKAFAQQISPITIDIPLPNGEFEKYMVFNAPIMEAELAQKFPEINTYIIQSIENRQNNGRVDVTPKGFHAMLHTFKGTFFIDPIFATDNTKYLSYYKKDFTTTKEKPVCLSEEKVQKTAQTIADNTLENVLSGTNLQKAVKTTNGLELRTYRFAVSATAEYTQFHGGTVTDGLSAIVTSVNRVNVVYERDFSVRLLLVANNDQVIFTNPNTDPFDDPSDAGQLLGENATTLYSIIGGANFDVGHVVGRSGSGLAGFGVVCRDNNFSNKANGTTGINNPVGDPFDIDYFAHEIGHQFAGSHTFNSGFSSCGSNRSQNSAYEPGSGTTIMAYAGLCGADNTQANSDDHFHARTLEQVIDFISDGVGDGCAVKSPTGNTIPQVTALVPVNLSIPVSTPFELEAEGFDADGDLLTYTWEQYDLGPAGSPNTPSGNAPLFRSFSPSTSPVRTFPQLSDIINNTQTIGEILPNYARTMRFRVTVRDNVAGHGAVNDDNVVLNVSNTGPFEVTSQNTFETWSEGNFYNITWNVAGTNSPPINTDFVDIYLSIDGGLTFPIQLADNVPNNGVFAAVAPSVITSQARIKVKAVGNVYFDINDTDFEIEVDCNAVDAVDAVDAAITFPQNLQDALWCENAQGLLDFNASSALAINSYQWFKDGTAISGETNKQLTFNNVQINDGGTYYCEVSNGCETANTRIAAVQITNNPIIPVITENNGVLQSSVPYNIQWYVNNIAINGATNQNFTPTQDGTYTVKSIAGNCSSTSAEFLATSLKDLNSIAAIQIKPNPSSGIFSVHIDNWNGALQYELVDVVGKRIYTASNVRTQFSVNLSDYPNGLYFLKLQSDNYQGVYKLIKK